LVSNDVKLGALTSSQPFALRPLYDHSLTHYFKVIITREDAYPQKPEPDGILECTRRMGILPASTLTIGDSPLDIQAGKRAGTPTLAVLGGVGSHAQLEAEEPTGIVEDVTQILSVLDLK
jgi:pyrophosphatase PpaX